MLFNTVSYLLFLACTVAIYWAIPRAARAWLLLVASLIFYAAWRVEFVLLISFSAFVDYYFSLRIASSQLPRNRKILLVASLSTNIALLLYFKYAYFLADNFATLGRLVGQDWAISVGNIILPLGISFYTFLSISYTVDVYRRQYEPIRSFSMYMTYVMFWPHMIAGPILRAHELIPQILNLSGFSAQRFVDGLRYIVFGLFLKVVLADQIAPWVDEAFAADFAKLGGLDVWTMAFAFGLQIYFDFAGYSMVAIGSALLLGVQFPENFNWPYLATSPREFWRRWHITLGSWIRDYLYLPLTGMRHRSESSGGIEIETNQTAHGYFKLALALYLTWFVMGLWHGASWSFAVWGIWHATAILLYRVSKDRFDWIPKQVLLLVGWGLTLSVAMIGWIPFRAGTLERTFTLFGRLLDIRSYGALAFRENFYLVTALMLIAILAARFGLLLRPKLAKVPYIDWALEMFITAGAMVCVFIFLRPISQFIYFQF